MILNMTRIKMFIKDICKNIAFYTRNKISGVQHDWGRFRQCDKWKLCLLRNIVSGVFAPMLIISGMLGFVFFCLFFRAHFYPAFIAMIVVTVLAGVYFVWSYICIDAKIEEEKNIKEFCED